MAVLKVNPNRMELSKLRKRLGVGQKGHKLLKDKQEQLIRNFFEIIKEYKTLRGDVEKNLIKAYQSFLLAKSIMGEEKIEEAILAPAVLAKIEFGEKQIMNLKVPTFSVKIEGDPLCYSPVDTSVELDDAIRAFSSLLGTLLSLAEVENSIVELSKEIIGTRRRVNALEYVLIPDLKETIKMIKSKLSEMERAAVVQLMFVK